MSNPPPAALIREFYSNLFIYPKMIGGHHLTFWIRGQEFTINKQTVSKALGVPVVCKPTYPYTIFPAIDDMMSLLYGCPISWGSEPRSNSCELIELNSLYLRISCHNIYPISHVHTIPIDRVHSFMLLLLMVLCVFPLCLFKPLLISIGVQVKLKSCSFLCTYIGF